MATAPAPRPAPARDDAPAALAAALAASVEAFRGRELLDAASAEALVGYVESLARRGEATVATLAKLEARAGLGVWLHLNALIEDTLVELGRTPGEGAARLAARLARAARTLGGISLATAWKKESRT
jgi:hypothetical protein